MENSAIKIIWDFFGGQCGMVWCFEDSCLFLNCKRVPEIPKQFWFTMLIIGWIVKLEISISQMSNTRYIFRWFTDSGYTITQIFYHNLLLISKQQMSKNRLLSYFCIVYPESAQHLTITLLISIYVLYVITS